MKRLAWLALLACGKSSSSSPPPAPAPAPPPARPAPSDAAIDLPTVHARPLDEPHTVLAWSGDQLVNIDASRVTAGKLANGSLTLAAGGPAADDGRPTKPFDITWIVAGRDVPAAKLHAAMAAHHVAGCLEYVGTDGHALAALAPLPCNSPEPDDEHAKLAVWADHDNITTGISRINDIAHVDRAKLADALAQHRASSLFTDDDEVAIAVTPDASYGDVVALMTIAVDAGFHAPRWVEPAGLPLDLVHGVPPAPPAAAPRSTLTIGQPKVTGELDKAILRRYVKVHARDLEHCYDDASHAQPALAGTVEAKFVISADGKVTSSDASGVAPALSSCVAKAIAGIEFPKPRSGGTVQVTYPLQFGPVHPR